MNHKKSGFTLIELLVVIAIIGILAAIVLASLNTARAKAADATIKSDLDAIRKQVTLYQSTNENYGDDVTDCASGMFTADTTIVNAVAQITTQGSTATCITDDGDPAVGTAATSYAVSAPFKSDPTQIWCVDSSGFSGLGVADNTTNANVAECH